MSISSSDLNVIKANFEEYAAAHCAVVAAMQSDKLSESMTRAEQSAADRVLALMRRMLPILVNTCERALAVDKALVDVRNKAQVVEVSILLVPHELTPSIVRTFAEETYRRAWRNGVDSAISVIESKLRP